MSREVPEGWRSGKLGDVVALEYGKALAASARTPGEVPVFGSSGIVGYHSQAAVEGPSIVISRKGSLGGVFFVQRKFWPIDTTYYVVRRETCDWIWLTYSLKFSSLERLNEATGVPGINRDKAAQQPILVPPLHEQRRIAEILSSVDEAIAATRAVIAQTRKVKQAVLERLLTKGIGHTRFKQTEIGEIPEGWPLATADEVCTQISVGIVIKPSQYYTDTGIRCFRSANVREGFIEDADWVYITEEGNRINRKSLLRTGDVLVVRTGYPGTSCVVTPKYDGTNCIDIIFARPDKNKIDATFLSTFVNSKSGKTQILKAEGGLAQKHFNVGAMKNMYLPLPPIEEQLKIVAHVQDLANSEAVLAKVLQQQVQTKSALMSDLLTGRKRVTGALPLAAE